MEKIIKYIIIFVFFTAFINFSFLATEVRAESFVDKIITQGDDFIKDGKNSKEDTIKGSKFKKVINNIYSVFMIIGVVVSVVIAAIIGIKIMTGSLEDKAEMKEQLTPYIIGIVVIFGSLSIWTVVMQIAGKV